MSPTLGQRLRQAREKMGLSLADVSHQTRIPVPRLKDMEDDNFNALGGMAYTRSFVQTYSKLLDVNASSVLEHMQTPPLGGARDYRYLVESFGSWINSRGDFSAPPAKAMTQTLSRATKLGIAFLVLLIGVGVLLGQAWLGDHKNNASTAARSPLPVIPAKVEDIAEIPRAVKVRDSSLPVPPATKVSKKDAAPPKALPVEDDAPSKSKR